MKVYWFYCMLVYNKFLAKLCRDFKDKNFQKQCKLWPSLQIFG